MQSALAHQIRHAALLVAALGAMALASASAQAATVSAEGDVLRYRDFTRGQLFNPEDNGVRLGVERGEFVITDTATLTAGPGCRLLVFEEGAAACGSSATRATMLLGRGDDTAVVDASIPVTVNGGDGADRLVAGRPEGQTRITFSGGSTGENDPTLIDTVSYRFAPNGVTVTKDGVANDGRPGDADNILADVEAIEGSPFADTLTGADVPSEEFTGGAGDDTVAGLGGRDDLVGSRANDGADEFSGGPGFDLVDYRDRPASVRVSLDDIADDGEAGERDNLGPDVERVRGTEHDDTLIGSPAKDLIVALAGDDLIDGKGGGDDVFCDEGRDEAVFYPGDDRFDCEGVGSFRLSPRRNAVRVGRPLALKLRWTHPVAWKLLDEVVLVLEHRGRRVGRILLDQETRRVDTSGRHLSLAGTRPRIHTQRGSSAITVRLALRFGRRLAGRTLSAKLGASQDDGARQEPARAGRIRIHGL